MFISLFFLTTILQSLAPTSFMTFPLFIEGEEETDTGFLVKMTHDPILYNSDEDNEVFDVKHKPRFIKQKNIGRYIMPELPHLSINRMVLRGA